MGGEGQLKREELSSLCNYCVGEMANGENDDGGIQF